MLFRKKLGNSKKSDEYHCSTLILLLIFFMQAKQDATELLEKKAALEKEKARIEEEASEKEKLRDKKARLIGNYVHESVPVNDNEVRDATACCAKLLILVTGF